MKNYTAQSCHEIGYKWNISAPDGLTLDDLECLQEAIVDYSDTPSEADLAELLVNPTWFLADYFDDLSPEKLELLALVKIEVKSVHRETFAQGLEEVQPCKVT